MPRAVREGRLGRAGMGMNGLPHADSLSLSLSHRRTHFCNRAPRIPLVHRAHVVRFELHGAATTIPTLQHHRIVVQLSFRRARLLIACAPTLSTTIPTTRLFLVAGRPYRLLQYALSRLSQSAISRLPNTTSRPQLRPLPLFADCSTAYSWTLSTTLF